jgi:hypothetical protein
MVSEDVRDMTAMQRDGHHGDFLYGICVGRKGDVLQSRCCLRKMVVMMNGRGKRVRNGGSEFGGLVVER